MDKFNADFERRLKRLYFAIGKYLSGVSSGDVLPALASCFTKVWCKSPYLSKKFKK